MELHVTLKCVLSHMVEISTFVSKLKIDFAADFNCSTNKKNSPLVQILIVQQIRKTLVWCKFSIVLSLSDP